MGMFDWLLGSGTIPTAGQIGAYNPPVEYGVDVQTPFHTPITAPLGGIVERTYTSGWGGNVVIQAQYMGQTVNEYVQHLDTIASNLSAGSQIAAGQFLGLSGGETQAQVAAGMYPGAQLPNSTQWSSGPHTEFGFNAPWQGGGPTIDPTSLLQNLASGNGPATQNLSNGQGLTSSGSPPWWCAFFNNDVLCQAVQNQAGQVGAAGGAISSVSSAITGLINNLPRIGIAIGASLLILIGLWHFMSKAGTTVNVQPPSVMTQKAQGSEEEEAGESSGAAEEAAAVA